MPTPHDGDLEFAVALAGRAGELLTASYERAMKAISDRFPADAILAEESGRQHGATRTARSRWARRAWVIDPLDGTVNYANGIPFFCVSIGLIEEGVPVVG